tara:strand:+ start:7903 stop:8091 length:189 start_codon:yes stop_codon:yes gene_type:complete
MIKSTITLLEHCQVEIKRYEFNITMGKLPNRGHLDGWSLAGLQVKLEKLKEIETILKDINPL